MWSAGVILFTMMCSYPPFWGESENEIYDKVRHQELQLAEADWTGRSSMCKQLVMQLLHKDPGHRLTVHEALAHPWVQMEGEVVLDLTARRDMQRTLARMRRFACYPLLKRVTLAVLAKGLPIALVTRELRIFRQLAASGREAIASEDLERAMSKHGLPGVDHALVDRLTSACDINKDKSVTSAELQAFLIPRQLYLDAPKLISVFETLDVDRDGYITLFDLDAIVSECGDPTYSESILRSGDVDEDGRISFADFLQCMCQGERDPF